MQQYDVVRVPQPRREPSLEDLVSRIADLVLKATGLAERYETDASRLAEPAAVAAQQARVRDLRRVADRGRRRLIEIGLRD